jgi:predicted enzyme related to lactoylglutathione lyase
MSCHGTRVVVIKIPEGKEIALSAHGVISNDAPGSGGVTNVTMKLEVVVIPVSNVDRAKEFYSRLGWRLDADRAAGDNFRLIQFTPPGSGSSIQFGVNLTSAAPGSAQALHLVVSDIVAGRQAACRAGYRRERGVSLCKRDWLQVSRHRRPRQRATPGASQLWVLCFIQGPGRQRLVAPGSHGTASWTRLGRNVPHRLYCS